MTSPVTPYSVSKGSCSKYCKELNLIPVLMKINTASATIPNNMAHAIPMAKPSLKVEIRNKGIANIFSQMGLIEAWGSGIKRILNAAEKYGLPKPRFQEFDNMFRVELFRKNSLTKRERIDFIDELELGRRRDGESSEKGRRRIAILN